MSDQDLDKLFRNKLEDHREMPSAEAWEQIRSSVGQKKSGFPLLKIAAAILVLCLSGAVVWFALPDNQTAPLATNSGEKSITDSSGNIDQAPAEKLNERQEIQEDNGDDENIPNNSVNPTPTDRDLPTREQPAVTSDERLAEVEMPDTDQTDKAADSKLTEAIQEIPEPVERNETPVGAIPEITEPELAKTADEPVTVGQTLTFSIDEFESAEEVAAMDESSEKNEEGLKKVWSFLQQVKEPEAGFGELRELKNNILAFGNTKAKKESD